MRNSLFALLCIMCGLGTTFCGNADDTTPGDTDTDTDTDTDSDTDTDTGTDSDSDTGTGIDTNPTGDYWEDGYCGDWENDVPASLDCKYITYEGCCLEGEVNLWCEQTKLWCKDCGAEDEWCSWMESYYGFAYYDCDTEDWGPDTSGEHPEDCDELADGGVEE